MRSVRNYHGLGDGKPVRPAFNAKVARTLAPEPLSSNLNPRGGGLYR